jgi:hypothetical protein
MYWISVQYDPCNTHVIYMCNVLHMSTIVCSVCSHIDPSRRRDCVTNTVWPPVTRLLIWSRLMCIYSCTPFLYCQFMLSTIIRAILYCRTNRHWAKQKRMVIGISNVTSREKSWRKNITVDNMRRINWTNICDQCIQFVDPASLNC